MRKTPINVRQCACESRWAVCDGMGYVERSWASLPNRYSALCWRPVTHAQTWASYSALYWFGRLSRSCSIARWGTCSVCISGNPLSAKYYKLSLIIMEVSLFILLSNPVLTAHAVTHFENYAIYHCNVLTCNSYMLRTNSPSCRNKVELSYCDNF